MDELGERETKAASGLDGRKQEKKIKAQSLKKG